MCVDWSCSKARRSFEKYTRDATCKFDLEKVMKKRFCRWASMDCGPMRIDDVGSCLLNQKTCRLKFAVLDL